MIYTDYDGESNIYILESIESLKSEWLSIKIVIKMNMNDEPPNGFCIVHWYLGLSDISETELSKIKLSEIEDSFGVSNLSVLNLNVVKLKSGNVQTFKFES